ncbi:hypothetical protein G6F50_014353 [Rhizopus delemar]|uniref:Uncharacterized protein n=1 Tax=Rhizopus delemar TaxID=936053 RepID=A0A9P6Y6C4_9FUNG|nr:hypothetical protein G6F50_014353 [Rhizopus delemar]
MAERKAGDLPGYPRRLRLHGPGAGGAAEAQGDAVPALSAGESSRASYAAAPAAAFGSTLQQQSPIDGAGNHGLHLATRPDLAVFIDPQGQARIVADFAALAGDIGAAAAGQHAALAQPGTDQRIGAAGDRVLGHVHRIAGAERAHDAGMVRCGFVGEYRDAGCASGIGPVAPGGHVRGQSAHGGGVTQRQQPPARAVVPQFGRMPGGGQRQQRPGHLTRVGRQALCRWAGQFDGWRSGGTTHPPRPQAGRGLLD